mgnify:CR=1 FL=1
MRRRLKRWRARRNRVLCPTCRRVNARGQECGTLKREGQDFADGGWVEWRSWNPCSDHAPGGVVPPKPLLDDDPPLDDVMLEISPNGGVYGYDGGS